MHSLFKNGVSYFLNAKNENKKTLHSRNDNTTFKQI